VEKVSMRLRGGTSVAVVVACALAACGGEASDGDIDVPEEAPAASTANLTGTITGAVQKDLSVTARFSCQDNVMSPDVFELVWGATEQLHVSLPFSSDPGTYDLSGSGEVGTAPGEGYEIRYRSEDLRTFDLGSGEITLETVPAAPGERAVGSFRASLSSEEGETIELSGEFDIETASYAFEGCG
jgi:hypothetical protein